MIINSNNVNENENNNMLDEGIEPISKDYF